MTLALVAGPMLYGFADRRFNHRRLVLTTTHVVAAVALLTVAGGSPGGLLIKAAGLPLTSPGFNVFAFFLLGAALSSQPLLFAVARDAVSPENAGKALAAVNLSFFAGAAVLQSCTGPIAASFGLVAMMLFLAGFLIVTATAFVLLTRRSLK